MNKEASFAGTFYPDGSEELNSLINSFKENTKIEYKSKAIIVPHAGLIYSGHAAMAGFLHLDFSETIFIIAPSHHKIFNNIALPKYTYFDTPLGSIEVNNLLIKEIAEKFPCIITDEPFENEHSIEVQLPFLQNICYPHKQNAADFVKNLTKLGKRLKIVPILVGRCDYKLIADLISEYWERASFVISSDLSHFYPQNLSRQIDSYTATIIETGKLECFEPVQACGLIGIKGLTEFANRNGYSLIRAEMYNSGDISNDKDRVVGYGSWYLYPDTTNNFYKTFYSQYILNTVKESIKNSLSEKEYIPKHIPPSLTQYGASFVTIKINGQLRGCIGSVYPTKPLIIDLIDNAKNAAFYDPRFIPIREEEFEHLTFSISLLSKIESIPFKDEKDLLTKIYPYGIVLSEREKRAVYLPVVWEQLPDKEIFLNSLKEKAGLPPDYFSKNIEAFKFTTTTISDETT